MKRSGIKSFVFAGLLALAAGALPALAGTFNSGPYNASRINTGGIGFTNMTASATTFCFLSNVGMRDTDSSTELAGCRVVRGPIVWTLQAELSQSDDADAFCQATCYNN